MSQAMEHIRELSSVIGPRPATTDAEADAADYIENAFKARGLDPERQEFDCPRTRSWAFVIYHVLTVGAAGLSLQWGLPALAIAILAAVMYRLDLQMRFSILRFLPKGPSQNIIARHVPRVRRGDRLQRVVLVAHYDSPRASLFAHPAVAKRADILTALTWWTTLLTPVVILIGVMPFAEQWKPWVGYAALVPAVYLLVPLVMHIYSEIVLSPAEGANDNASGIAALLGVMEATVPDTDQGTTRIAPVRRSVEAAQEADVIIEDALLEYRPVDEYQPSDTGQERTYEAPSLDGFDDLHWETGPVNLSTTATPRPTVPGLDDEMSYTGRPYYEDRYGEERYGDEEFEAGGDEADTDWAESEVSEDQEQFSLPEEEQDDAEHAGAFGRLTRSARRGASRERGRSRVWGSESAGDDSDLPDEPGDLRDVSSWLGVDSAFDVRRAGKRIGNWDNIDEDSDDFGFKGGMAEGGLFDSGTRGFASAARIRKRVTEDVDRALSEKEIWFVATGAEGAGAWGMRALLADYSEEMRDALIIVIDGVGSGAVSFVTAEGLAREYRADRRLVAQAKRTSREHGFPVTAKTTHGVLTDALPALAARFKAMSVMAFDINGRLPDRLWTSDTIENISETTVERATIFVTELVRDL